MIVVGGRTNTVGESVPFEVYDTDSSEWFRFSSILRFRHACIELDSTFFVHGGFEHETPNIPTSKMLKIDIAKLFKDKNSATRGKVSPKTESRPLPPAPEEKRNTISVISNPTDRGNPLQNIFINHLLRPSE